MAVTTISNSSELCPYREKRVGWMCIFLSSTSFFFPLPCLFISLYFTAPPEKYTEYLYGADFLSFLQSYSIFLCFSIGCKAEFPNIETLVGQTSQSVTGNSF